MGEEIKEELPKKEYKKVGEMLLALIAECPYIPADLRDKPDGIQYQSRGTGKCISIITPPGGRIKSKNVLGEFTAEIHLQIAYKSFPDDNTQAVNAQDVVDKIMEWLGDIENLPSLSGGRRITDITPSPSFGTVDDAGEDKSTVFVANAVIEYEAG